MKAQEKLLRSNTDTQESKNVLFEFVFFNVLGIISVIISVITLDTSNSIYKYVFILPLITGVMYFISLFGVKNIKKNYINMLIYILFFTRNVFSIWLLFLADFENRMPIYNQNQMNKSILLMSMETLVVFLMLYKLDKPHKNKRDYVTSRVSRIFKLFLFLSSLICLLSYLVDPLVKNSYTTIFSGNLTLLESTNLEYTYSIWFRLFNFLFPMLQLLLPLYLITIIRNKMGQTGVSLLLSLTISISPLLMIGSSSAYALIATVTLLITILNFFGKYRQVLFGVIGLGIGVFLLVYIFEKFKVVAETRQLNYALSDIFQSYFPGITNIAGALLINQDQVSIKLFLNELKILIPLRGFIISGWDNRYRAIYFFQEAVKNPHQIMANISVGFLYIRYFAPVLSAIMVFISNWFYQRDSENSITYGVNIMVSIYFAIGLVMLSVVNVSAQFSETLIWMLILAKISTVKEKNN